MITITHATREETAARQFAALGDTSRLHILVILREHPGTLTVEGLTDELRARYRQLAQPTISYHLRILSHAGFLTCVKHDHHSYYSVRAEVLVALRDAIGGQL